MGAGGVMLAGGGSCFGYTQEATFIDNHIVSNTAGTGGGGILVWLGGKAILVDNGIPQLESNTPNDYYVIDPEYSAVLTASLATQVTGLPSPATLGRLLDFTYVVTNTGDVQLGGQISPTFPSKVITQAGSDVLSGLDFDLSPGEVWSTTKQFTIASDAPTGTITVSVEAETDIGATASDQEEIIIQANPRPYSIFLPLVLAGW